MLEKLTSADVAEDLLAFNEGRAPVSPNGVDRNRNV